MTNNEQFFFVLYGQFVITALLYFIIVGFKSDKITVGGVLGSIVLAILPGANIIWIFPLIAEICSITLWKKK